MATQHTAVMEPFNIEAEIASSLDDMSEGDLRSFAELHEDPENDDQIELHIYTCFLIFTRTRSTEHLEQAIQRTEGWIAVTATDHPDRTRRFQILDMMSARMSQRAMLGSLLGTRFERTGSMDDLNRAVEVANMAVDATPQNHPNRAGWLSNLGNHLGRRFERTGPMDDLNRAVEVANMAVDATPQNHPDRAAMLYNLGNWLGTRFERTGSMDDLNRALSSYKEGWSCRTAPPSIRIRSARQAATILASQSNWQESSGLLHEAVNLLHAVSPRSLKHTDKQHMLANFAGLASMAAATALNAGSGAFHALQRLELGRGIIAGLLMDMRGDISDLKRKHPNLADEFIALRDELDSPADRPTSALSSDGTSSWESQAKRRREADQKFGELITSIRAQPGFDGFLRPPAAGNLMAAANPDPIVVINLSPYRCDAFLIERDRIRVLELPDLTMEEVQKRAQDLRFSRATGSFHILPLLEWLWDAAARPCIDALGLKNPVSDDNWPRVWWIPTGLLSQMPLHAAGRHVRGSTETVLDRVMSSYASSVKALIHGRQHPVRRSAGPFSDCALLVAMHETPNLSGNGILPFAANEVKMLKNLCRELQLWSLTPILRKDNVLKHLQTCKIFHFAGHGQSDPAEPSRSCLLLEDWKTSPLTVGDLRDHRLQEKAPFLGFLSACSTGANKAAQLADEGIHLVSAFQLAGFRHVVGTLWEVSDKHCVDVARVLYETLRDEGMTDVAICRGLHRAVRTLRDGRTERRQEARDGHSDLISHFLTVDPEMRYIITEFLAHPWIRGLGPTPRDDKKFPPDGMLRAFDASKLKDGDRRYDFRSPGAVNLREVFDVGYAVHRQEEGKRRDSSMRDTSSDESREYAHRTGNATQQLEQSMRATNIRDQERGRERESHKGAPTAVAAESQQRGYGQHSAAVTAAARQQVHEFNNPTGVDNVALELADRDGNSDDIESGGKEHVDGIIHRRCGQGLRVGRLKQLRIVAPGGQDDIGDLVVEPAGHILLHFQPSAFIVGGIRALAPANLVVLVQFQESGSKFAQPLSEQGVTRVMVGTAGPTAVWADSIVARGVEGREDLDRRRVPREAGGKSIPASRVLSQETLYNIINNGVGTYLPARGNLMPLPGSGDTFMGRGPIDQDPFAELFARPPIADGAEVKDLKGEIDC
ncbi:hypothetical protein GGTG_13264 [Gaeumannomyces tritici R3-111a-1]|uniref:CHAT domain-containing protein n=1 Tax=Gaeumannomyces tritici (strain R3-111a-1) TaxID=644352 RepID=J3PID6_GAET3|nr:hypothetical protein GGTG_13264 [Gaeumannomyces tritici R3-111a-1]EJT69155.1 hypothetical protein GGTG_13264 [Gaeumannomyces tritici R3-111a-1]